MTKYNDLFWNMLFHAVKPLTDNVGFMVILYSVFFGILFTGISYLYRKESSSFLGVFDGVYLLSVFAMLKHLPLIHQRIHRALSTVSSIILASSSYTNSFNAASGLSVTKPSQIVYYLYSLSLQQLKTFNTVNPDLLYQKFYNAIKKTRFFLGSYIDGRVHSFGVYTGVIILVIFLTFFAIAKANRIPWVFFVLQFSYILFASFSRNGCVLALLFLVLSRIVFATVLRNLPAETFSGIKKHIIKAKKERG